jgi:hypothetical protein
VHLEFVGGQIDAFEDFGTCGESGHKINGNFPHNV